VRDRAGDLVRRALEHGGHDLEAIVPRRRVLMLALGCDPALVPEAAPAPDVNPGPGRSGRANR
jgi:hypothetical protein